MVTLTLKLSIGPGLRDEEIKVSFARMIHRKMEVQQSGTSLSWSAENVFKEVDKYDPLINIVFKRSFST